MQHVGIRAAESVSRRLSATAFLAAGGEQTRLRAKPPHCCCSAYSLVRGDKRLHVDCSIMAFYNQVSTAVATQTSPTVEVIIQTVTFLCCVLHFLREFVTETTRRGNGDERRGHKSN